MVVEPLIGEGLKGAAIEFVDYGRLIISVMILYYAIRFFTISDEEEDRIVEEQWRERGQKYSDYLVEMKKKSDEKNALKSRRLHVTPAEACLIESRNVSEEVLDAITDHKHKEYIRKIKILDTKLMDSMKALRSSRRQPVTFDINVQIAALGVLRNIVASLLDPVHQPKTDAELKNKATHLTSEVKTVRDGIAPVLDTVKKYISP